MIFRHRRDDQIAVKGANHAHAIKKKQYILAQTSKKKTSIYDIQIRVHVNPLYMPKKGKLIIFSTSLFVVPIDVYFQLHCTRAHLHT